MEAALIGLFAGAGAALIFVLTAWAFAHIVSKYE